MHHIHNCFTSLNYSCHLFLEIHSVHNKTGQTQYDVCFPATCLNVVLTLSRLPGETQQMVTSVNFTSDCTPLEDLIISGLRALPLILYINVVNVTASASGRFCLCNFRETFYRNILFFLFIITIFRITF